METSRDHCNNPEWEAEVLEGPLVQYQLYMYTGTLICMICVVCLYTSEYDVLFLLWLFSSCSCSYAVHIACFTECRSYPPLLPPHALESFQLRGASPLLLYLAKLQPANFVYVVPLIPIAPPHLSYIQLTGDGKKSLILKKLQSVLSNHPSPNLEKM